MVPRLSHTPGKIDFSQFINKTLCSPEALSLRQTFPFQGSLLLRVPLFLGSDRFELYFYLSGKKIDCVCPPWCNHQRAAPTSCSWTPPWSPGSSGGSRASHIWFKISKFHPQPRRSIPNHTCLRTPRALTEESCREASPLSSSSHRCWRRGRGARQPKKKREKKRRSAATSSSVQSCTA